MRTVYIILIAVFILWLFFSALLLNAYLSRRANEEKALLDDATDNDSASADPSQRQNQAVEVGQQEPKSQVATANEDSHVDEDTTTNEDDEAVVTSEDAGNDQSETEKETEKETALEAEKETIAVETGTGKRNEPAVDDRSADGKKSGRRVGDVPEDAASAQDEQAVKVEANDAEEVDAAAVEHPDVDETACAVVDKNSKRRGSKKRRRGKSKRNQAKIAASETTDSTATPKVESDSQASAEPSSQAETADSPTSGDPEIDNEATQLGDADLSSSDKAEIAEETAASDPSKVTISTLLADIDLPYDLHSISDGEADVDRHTTFVSSHSDPAEVGTAFADELERVGFEIEPAGVDEAIAKRNGYTLTMRITPDAGSTENYPDLGRTDIAIETWIL